MSRIPYLLALPFAAGYAVLSVSRHRQVRTTGFDLGLFEQAVRSYAHGRAAFADLKAPGFPLLGDHFHPILAVLAPAYRIAPSPVTLLVAQAILLALSSVPVTRLAIATLGRGAGIAIGVAYGLSWGIQQTVAFDFHEVAFAVPLLAFSLERLARREWVPAVAWAAPLVLVKEDLAATVAAIGLYIAIRGRHRLGWAVAACAVLVLIATVTLIIPAINPSSIYPYAHSAAADGQPLWTRLIEPWRVKARTLLYLLAPTLFVALRSPLLLLAAPTVAWRCWGTNPGYWGTQYHYSAILMPIVFVASIDALSGFRRPRAFVVGALAIALALLPTLPLRELVQPVTWRGDPAAVRLRTALEEVPDGASVAAVNRLAPQLTSRCRVYLFPTYPSGDIRPEWIVLADPPDDSLIPAPERVAREAQLPSLGYHLVAHHNGVILWRRYSTS